MFKILRLPGLTKTGTQISLGHILTFTWSLLVILKEQRKPTRFVAFRKNVILGQWICPANWICPSVQPLIKHTWVSQTQVRGRWILQCAQNCNVVVHKKGLDSHEPHFFYTLTNNLLSYLKQSSTNSGSQLGLLLSGRTLYLSHGGQTLLMDIYFSPTLDQTHLSYSKLRWGAGECYSVCCAIRFVGVYICAQTLLLDI